MKVLVQGYILSERVEILNILEYWYWSISTMITNVGWICFQLSKDIDLSKAYDIKEVCGLEGTR